MKKRKKGEQCKEKYNSNIKTKLIEKKLMAIKLRGIESQTILWIVSVDSALICLGYKPNKGSVKPALTLHWGPLNANSQLSVALDPLGRISRCSAVIIYTWGARYGADTST